MLSRTLKRCLVDIAAPTTLPSTFLLPLSVRLSTSSHSTSSSNIPEPIVSSTVAPPSAKQRLSSRPPASRERPTSGSRTSSDSPEHAVLGPSSTATNAANTPLSDSVRSLLPLLRAQSPHYITAHIHAKPYLLTAGDTLRLPFLMHGVKPGDVLRLNRASVLGSRDYTLKARAKASPPKGSTIAGADPDPGYIDERLFVCRATVVGVVSEPMRVKEKTKRRQRRIKRVMSKHRYTVLRVSELTVRGVEDVEDQGLGMKI